MRSCSSSCSAAASIADTGGTQDAGQLMCWGLRDGKLTLIMLCSVAACPCCRDGISDIPFNGGGRKQVVIGNK